MPWRAPGISSTAGSISSSTRGLGTGGQRSSSPAASIAHAGTMNKLPKTVFSTTLPDDPGWNATVVRDDLPAVVARLKEKGEGDLFMFGGAGIAQSSSRKTDR